MKTVRNILIALIAPMLLFNWPQIFRIPTPVVASMAAVIAVGFVLCGTCLVLKNRQQAPHDETDHTGKRFVGYLCIGGGSTLLSVLWSFRSLFGKNLSGVLTSLEQYAAYSLLLIFMSFVFALAFPQGLYAMGTETRRA